MYVSYIHEGLADNKAPHTWHPKGRPRRNPSGLHIAARKLLKDMFPSVALLEEVSIQPTPFKTLYLDFYIPVLCYAIEVHGEQHYKFVQHYHTTAQQFVQSRKNDTLKKEWCIANHISFIELPFNQQHVWRDIINGF